tara:strand:- start:82 stop:861 length:780 start_codon:yes stop_codon:yes gene_type:complete
VQYLEIIILGLLQGITEFLPISSSGHLLIGRKIFGINEYGILIEVFLHMGTLLSIIIYWYKDIKNEYQIFISGNKNYFYCIIVGTIPAVIVGLLLNDFIKDNFFDISSMRYLPFNYLILSIIIFSSKYIKNNKIGNIFLQSALIIGIAQSLAILPGLSRSGLTIIMGLYLGLNFKVATKYSFMLAIPILLFAAIDSIYDYFIIENFNQNINLLLMIGFIASFTSGYLMLVILQKIIENRKLWYFSFYCLLISMVLFYGI